MHSLEASKKNDIKARKDFGDIIVLDHKLRVGVEKVAWRIHKAMTKANLPELDEVRLYKFTRRLDSWEDMYLKNNLLAKCAGFSSLMTKNNIGRVET